MVPHAAQAALAPVPRISSTEGGEGRDEKSPRHAGSDAGELEKRARSGNRHVHALCTDQDGGY